MGINLNPPSPPKFYDIFIRNMKIFDDDLSRAKKDVYRVTAEVFQDLNQLFWNLKSAELHLEVTASNDAVETGFHKVVSLKMRKAGLELWKFEKIFDTHQDPSKKISSQTIETFDKGIAKIEAEIANEETQGGTEYNFDMESITPVDDNAEESAQEVHENVLIKAQKVFPVDETEVDNLEPKPSEEKTVAFDESRFFLPETLKAKLAQKSSFQEDLQKTRNMLVSFGFDYKFKEKTAAELDTSVDESKNEFEATRVLFPFDPGEVAGPVSETTQAQKVKSKPDEKEPNVEEEFFLCSRCDSFDDFGLLEVEENRNENTTNTETDVDVTALWLQILLEIRSLIQVLLQLVFSMPNLMIIIARLLNPLFMNTTSDVMTKEPSTLKENVRMQNNPEDKKEMDATEDEASTTATFQNESFPYDPGKTFDITNDVKEAATDDLDAGKTTSRVQFEDLYVHECSGSRNLIQDDLLFQQVAPSVVLCLYDCHVYRIILRSPAILLAQLHMLYRHPASCCNVTNATKTYVFPDVNTEACVVDEKLFDGKEQQEDCPEEVYEEKEFGTLGDGR